MVVYKCLFIKILYIVYHDNHHLSLFNLRATYRAVFGHDSQGVAASIEDPLPRTLCTWPSVLRGLVALCSTH